MIITHPGHAMFLLETDSGVRIVTDPVDEESGYSVAPLAADIVTVSHGHHDHACVEKVTGDPMIVREAGVSTLDDVRVTCVPSWHDREQGAKRGPNLLTLIEADGLRVAHLGDLGHLPTPEQLSALKPVDVLMIPVGGFFTIDAAEAKKTAELLAARVIIPMHYRTDATASWPIAPVENFLALYPAERVSRQKLLRVTAGDLACQKQVVVLD